ncbi:Rhodanese-like domain-containing protein [Halteromyces radiatus]|uniref:Rhodanese-like domain-containing protein n=1 Tax=Halteromyces radiatus TaxID=101107 RepID=UPI00221E5E8C|nr:Rhodanese-like domain-containing protein [Halteromyces radiatus]KAI8093152.1 Rhodanese-like domain-containing protein [Halteromyces radiatus]
MGRRDYTTTKQKVADQPRYITMAFYKFHDIPASTLPELRSTLLQDLGALGVVGRIYISTEGINAQMSCPDHGVEALRDYCTSSIAPLLGGELMDLNIATQGDSAAFRALHVRIRKQLVADGLDPTTYDLKNTPSHLSPKDWHEKLVNYKEIHGKEPVLIDMRNHYESNIGFFEGAIRPDADTFRDSITAMNEICKDLPRDQEIFMYCTGGIRCSKAGAILQSQSGFDKVHLVEGGITAYGRWIQDQEHLQSIFRGKNFTFDGRMGETITDEITGTQCHICPVLVDGVRAYVKEGHTLEESKRHDRVVIGTSGKACEHEYHRRTRAIEVLGQPGQVLQEWAKAGRQLPPSPTTSS